VERYFRKLHDRWKDVYLLIGVDHSLVLFFQETVFFDFRVSAELLMSLVLLKATPVLKSSNSDYGCMCFEARAARLSFPLPVRNSSFNIRKSL